MPAGSASVRVSPGPRVLAYPPAELSSGKLDRIGEGIGKVVYASAHWVVKRERSGFQILALILLWRVLRRVERVLPGRLGRALIDRPSRQLRYLRILMQGVMLVLPKSVWFTTHVRQVWKVYHRRSLRGERLAEEQLAGTLLVPEAVIFPPVRVRVGGWPGWLIVSQATERAETTLHQRLAELAGAGRFTELERWLDRFLALRQSGWQLGLFSVDAHLKNFGIIGERIVLLDTGGLTDRWEEVESRLEYEDEVERPHQRLGLGEALAGRPDIAERFDARWKSTVSRAVVARHWPK